MKRSASICMENDTFTILTPLKGGPWSRPWQTSSGMGKLHCCWHCCFFVGPGSWMSEEQPGLCSRNQTSSQIFFLRQSRLPLHLLHNRQSHLRKIHLVQTLRNQVQPPGGSDLLWFVYQNQDKAVQSVSWSCREPPEAAELDNSGFIHCLLLAESRKALIYILGWKKYPKQTSPSYTHVYTHTHTDICIYIYL